MPFNQSTPPDLRRDSKPRKALITKAQPDLIQGRVLLNRYRVNSRLARGGMSSVYLARDVNEGILYAIKVLRPELVTEIRLRERFLNESRAVQRIDHPAVVQICDVGEMEDGRIILVMEYVHGASLRKMIKRDPISAANAIPIVGAITEGLAAAHEQCVIHRDLKPENVLLPKKPTANSLVKLVDFGIARIIDAPRITTTQHVMGTPQYIAPEQAMGLAVDNRADIYALGVIMYEMLTGKLPFKGDDPETLLRQHITIPPPPLSAQAPETQIPEEFRYLVMRCLSKSPKNRPANTDEVLSLLSKVRTQSR